MPSEARQRQSAASDQGEKRNITVTPAGGQIRANIVTLGDVGRERKRLPSGLTLLLAATGVLGLVALVVIFSGLGDDR